MNECVSICVYILYAAAQRPHAPSVQCAFVCRLYVCASMWMCAPRFIEYVNLLGWVFIGARYLGGNN